MTDKERPIASVHIPRTAGSSLRKFWIDLYGPEEVLLYSIKTGSFHPAVEDGIFSRSNPIFYFIRDVLATCRLGKLYRLVRKLDYQRRMARTFADDQPSEFKVIHGHFSPDFILGRFGNVRLVTIIRDPLERTISQYFFLRHLESVDPQDMPPWYTPGMPFNSFAFLGEVVNYQTQFLGSHGLRLFDLVGTTDDFEIFCRSFDPQGAIRVSRLNTAPRFRLELSDDFLMRFKEEHKLDCELYEAACGWTRSS